MIAKYLFRHMPWGANAGGRRAANGIGQKRNWIFEEGQKASLSGADGSFI